MIFQTVGNIENPAVLFFHAMGVTGKSSSPVAEHLKDRYYCIMPTSTVYCAGQNYISKADELRQLLNIRRSRSLLFLSTTLLAGTITAFCGPIGFIGLAMPMSQECFSKICT